MSLEPAEKTGTHARHHADISRLNRIAGQLQGVKKMVEEERYCTDILTQIRAIRAALKGVEANILERHLEHCINDSLKAGHPDDVKAKINELKDVFRRYDE